MVILFLSELQLGKASEPSNNAIFLWILGSSGKKSTLTSLFIVLQMNQENYRYILNQLSNKLQF
jgi:hypothetical protein